MFVLSNTHEIPSSVKLVADLAFNFVVTSPNINDIKVTELHVTNRGRTVECRNHRLEFLWHTFR
jgi:hypothetical protein